MSECLIDSAYATRPGTDTPRILADDVAIALVSSVQRHALRICCLWCNNVYVDDGSQFERRGALNQTVHTDTNDIVKSQD